MAAPSVIDGAYGEVVLNEEKPAALASSSWQQIEADEEAGVLGRPSSGALAYTDYTADTEDDVDEDTDMYERPSSGGGALSIEYVDSALNEEKVEPWQNIEVDEDAGVYERPAPGGGGEKYTEYETDTGQGGSSAIDKAYASVDLVPEDAGGDVGGAAPVMGAGPAPWTPTRKRRYKKELLWRHGHDTENESSKKDLRGTLPHLLAEIKRKVPEVKGMGDQQILGDPAIMKAALVSYWGWSAQEAEQYWVDRLARNTKVTYLKSDAERAQYAVIPGPTMTRANGDVLDTGGMYSTFSGSGWAIYVLDAAGNMYVGAHRVGLFHHTSFTGGKDVAAAGEIKVENGVMRGITNKSGHYRPKEKQISRTLRQLEKAGVKTSRIKDCRVFLDVNPNHVLLCTGAGFLRRGNAARGSVIDIAKNIKLRDQ
ncbi:MAG TPA: hypothetical protein VHX88_14555 [Solirubrobacteraceae bacterium]|nr:hypothetical protein [Solirubrobacteraceae bacterium]